LQYRRQTCRPQQTPLGNHLQHKGGYYTRTRENRPLIGRMGVEGAHVIGAVAGFGIMSACGAGDLLAMHILRGKIPADGFAFELSRYDDPHYRLQVEGWKDDGQL
jgi:glycine/D-amino acid oxidase-like deaminating enzyme